MGFVGNLFSGSSGMGYEPERAASGEQAQQLYEQQQQKLAQQQAFTQALMAQSPQALAAQQQVLGQLTQQAQGVGPSIAQRALAETTGQNVANTAALMASKRGASANAGLVGRQAALAGMGAQQQAAGQAATLRAQEQIMAQQQAANLAGQQLGQVAGAQATGLQAQQGAQQNVMNAIANRNATLGQIQQQVAGGQQQLFGGLLGGAAQVGAKLVGFAEGGEVSSEPKMGEAGYWKKIQEEHQKLVAPEQRQKEPLKEGAYQMGTALGSLAGKLIKGSGYAYGGEVPAMLSPGEKYLPPREVEEVAKGKKPVDKAGKIIPGRAKVDGDSLKNDTVHARLEEGGIVIPRSVMQSKNPSEQARKFVDAVLARQAMKRK